MKKKYQEALKELKEFVHSELDGTWMLDEYLKHCDTLQELVDKNKNYILEEIKKEWEEEGWKWEKTSYFIVLEKNGVDIQLYLETKQYSCSQTSSYILDFIGIKEHQLLTKTFKALGWE